MNYCFASISFRLSHSLVSHRCYPLLTSQHPLSLPYRGLQLNCSSSNTPPLSTPPSLSSRPPPKSFSVRTITKDDVDFSFARSSGAGGQNVNKVSTKVDMRLNIDKATWIPEEIRAHIKKVEKNKLNSEGFIVVSSQLTRMQSQNMEDALAKLQAIIDSAVGDLTVKEADEETIKRVKANIKAGQERRMQDKKKDGLKKKERSRRDFD